jgi:hypothetical protein
VFEINLVPRDCLSVFSRSRARAIAVKHRKPTRVAVLGHSRDELDKTNRKNTAILACQTVLKMAFYTVIIRAL